MFDRWPISGKGMFGFGRSDFAAILPTKTVGHGMLKVTEKNTVGSLQLVRGKEVMK